jgi:hypothetical protein
MVNLDFRRGLKNLGDLIEHTLTFFPVFTADGRDHTRVHVFLKDDLIDFIQGSVYGMDLPDDINAIFTLIDHAADSGDMTFDGFQTF